MSPLVPPLVFGLVVWSGAAWAAFPREIWDAPPFGWAWVAVTLAAPLLARHLPPVATTAALFAPLPVVLTVTGILTGGGFGFLPLGLVAMLILALPALALAGLAAWLRRRG